MLSCCFFLSLWSCEARTECSILRVCSISAKKPSIPASLGGPNPQGMNGNPGFSRPRQIYSGILVVLNITSVTQVHPHNILGERWYGRKVRSILELHMWKVLFITRIPQWSKGQLRCWPGPKAPQEDETHCEGKLGIQVNLGLVKFPPKAAMWNDFRRTKKSPRDVPIPSTMRGILHCGWKCQFT